MSVGSAVGSGVNRRTFTSPEERLGEVKDLISERGAVRIDQLAADFGVSEMTIRRDLDELEALGVARRVRGGAIALGPEPFARGIGTMPGPRGGSPRSSSI